MAVYPLLFPKLKTLGYSSFRRPHFNTIVQQAASGRTVRAALQVLPLTEFETTFELLRDMTQNFAPDWQRNPYVELQEITQLFMSCYGQYGSFLWDCEHDNSRAQGFIGNGDGSTSTFVVQRAWGFGDSAFFEPVGAITRIDALYYNGALLDEGAVSATLSGNQVTFSPAPPGNTRITADFYFSYLCRWLDDMQEYEQWSHNLWTYKKCKFISIKQQTIPAQFLTDDLNAPLLAG